MEVKEIKDLSDGFEFIVSNDGALKQKHGFQSTSSSLIRDFMIFFNIRLYFIIIEEGTFQKTTEYITLTPSDQTKQAFIVLNGDKTVWGVLYTYNLEDRIQPVFDIDDMRIQYYVDKYTEQLNLTEEKSNLSIDSNTVADESGDAISTLPNSSDQISLPTTEDNIRVYTPNDHIAQDIVHQNNKLVVHNILTPLIQESGRVMQLNLGSFIFYIFLSEINTNNGDRIRKNAVTTCEQDRSVLEKIIDVQLSYTNLAQRGGSHHARKADQMDISNASDGLITMSHTTEVTSAPSSTFIKYKKPVLLKPIRPYWKIRHPKDLAKKSRKTTTGDKQTKTRYIELLHSIGDGNAPLKVKVPPREERKMFLASAVRTILNQPHSSKIIVPKGTKVDINLFNRNNNLNYLEFHECDPMHTFDLGTKIVYMEITPEEHEQKLKKIPIYMVNLYQNQQLTKDMIKREKLNECQLVFWLCVKSHGKIIPVSAESWIGPVQPYLWGNLCDCMKHMAEYGCNMEHSLSWVQDTLDGISLSLTPAQLNYIFNGYANLYKIVIDVISITDNVPVNLEIDIDQYDGTSSESEQEKRCRNITFVMYNPETFSFAILYAIDSDGNRQTCFAIDDQRIFDHLGGLFEKLNQEIMERELSIDNDDATIINTEESHSTDNVNAHLSSSSSSSKNDSSSDTHSKGCTYELSVESHDDLTTSKRQEDHTICISQSNSQSNFYSTHEEPRTTSIDNIQNVLSDMDTINRDIHQELNSTEESLPQTTQIDCHQEIADNTSTETNDCRMNTSLDSKARKSISKNIVHRIIRKAKTKRIRSSNNNSLSVPVTLSETTKKTASAVVSNVHSSMVLIIKYDPLKILKQPRRYRRVRMQNDLNKKRCPLVQAGNEDEQRIYPEIELPNNADDNVKLYVRVRVVTESGHSHPSQCVAPETVNINISVMDNNNECVFLIITDEERHNRRKIIKVHLFKRLHYFVSTEKNTEIENLRLCKLEYTLCEQSTSGEYQLVSQPSYTSIIELMDKDVTVDATEVKPKQLCQLGGEEISVPLSTKCKKSDFHIECNDQELKNTQYKMEGKKLIIFSPESKSTNHLHLTISRKEYNEDISEYQMKLLHNGFIPHVVHGKCTHTCGSCN
ncbi:unnamed protein product [Adineta steineri]|uniref:Uncharacterized protein n=1 Tax=Adineta steineri TaxID=433720 RepID=A0A814B1J6_9BILA|nr:unnamed protein product [Adineta steineri]CAF0922998.1 unnamed protein product [Adineta steineri]